MENIVYLSVLILLAVGWGCTYLYMLIKLNETYETDEVYEEEYTIYKNIEGYPFFISSIEYDETIGAYCFKYHHEPEDEYIRLPKYEAIALTLALNRYQENEEERFELKKM